MLEQAGKLEAAGKHVVHLEIGQPFGDAPAHVTQAAFDAINSGHTKYVAPSGIDRLREAISTHVQHTRSVHVSSSSVVVSPGCKPGLFNCVLAVCDAGSDLLYPDPGFPTYKALADVASANGLPVPLKSDGSGFDMNELRASVSKNTSLVIVNSPSNPTSGVMAQADVQELVRLAHEYDFYILSDEIYSQLVFSEARAAVSPLTLAPERTIMVDGASKAYRMTGWRLGWTIAPQEIASTIGLLAVHSFGCTAPFVQAAGIAALEGPQDDVQQMVDEYRRKRDFVVDGLNSIDGIECEKGDGAFYAFPHVQKLGLTAQEFAQELLHEQGVALLPGTDFGDNGEGHVRISFVGDMESLEQGIERIALFARSLS